jgi:hypothetical protein
VQAWYASASKRLKGTGCPFCAKNGKVCCRLTSAANNPELANSFDQDHPENQGYDIEKMSPYTQIDVWWNCTNTCPGQLDCRHKWKTSPSSRNCGHNCKYCSEGCEDPCCNYTSCANITYAETMKDFDLVKNSPFTPRDYRPQSCNSVHWLCQFCNAKWQTKIRIRTTNRSVGCKECRKR